MRRAGAPRRFLAGFLKPPRHHEVRFFRLDSWSNLGRTGRRPNSRTQGNRRGPAAEDYPLGEPDISMFRWVAPGTFPPSLPLAYQYQSGQHRSRQDR